MPTELDDLSIRISSDATKAGAAIESIVSALGKLKSVSANLSDISKITSLISGLKDLNGVTISTTVATQLGKIGEALNTLPTDDRITNLVHSLTEFGQVAGNFVGVASNIRSLSKLVNGSATGNLKDLANGAVVVSQETDGAREALEQFANELERTNAAAEKTKPFSIVIGHTDPKIENYYERVHALVAALPAPTHKVREAFTALGNTAFNVFDTIARGVQKAAGFMWGLAKKVPKLALKGLEKSAKAALSPVMKLVSGTKNLFRSVARIAGYRAIRTFIKLVTSGLKEGIDAMYSWSKEMGGQFAESMDTIATKTHYIGRSLSAMLAPLINLSAVILQRVTPAFVGMINAFNKFLATLTGQDYYTIATEGLVEYGDTISGAADKTGRAAKEIRDAVIGIDELNIISQNNGSGNGDEDDLGGSFVDEFLNENDKNGFAAQLAEAIDKQDWSKVGTVIADKINSFFSDKTKIKDFGKSVGKFIKNGLSLVSSLLSKTDFVAIGSSIAEFLNSIFSEFDDNDAYNLGQTLANALTALPRTCVGFLTKLDWAAVGSKFGTTLGSMISGLADFIKETDWGKLAGDLATGLINLVTNANLWQGLLDLGTAMVGGILKGIGDLGITVIDALLALFGLDPAKVWEKGKEAMDHFVHGILRIEKPNPHEAELQDGDIVWVDGRLTVVGGETEDDAFARIQKTLEENGIPVFEGFGQEAGEAAGKEFFAAADQRLGEDYWDEYKEPWGTLAKDVGESVGDDGGNSLGIALLDGVDDIVGNKAEWDSYSKTWKSNAESAGTTLGTASGKKFATSFKAAVSTWLGDDYWDEFAEPWAKNTKNAMPKYSVASMDSSSLNKYANGTLDTTVSTQASLVATGFEEGMERLITTYFVPVLTQIALDTTATANKPDPVFEVDGRTLARAVNTQNRVNGYSFS